jgi:hypothetical protein
MSDDSNPPHPPGEPGQPGGAPTQPNLRARVPDHVSRGVFSTGVIVITRPTEVVLDFVQTIGRPQRIAARIVMPPAVLPQFIDALRKNVELYRNRFGAPVTPAAAQEAGSAQQRRSAEEIYDDLELPDALLSGAYANGVMIGHGATEFSLDFLTNFFPQSAVSARVYLAAGQIPRLLESLRGAYQSMPPQPPPGSSPGTPGDASGNDGRPDSSEEGEEGV